MYNSFANFVEETFLLRDALAEVMPNSVDLPIEFDSVMTGIRYLMDARCIHFASSTFVDCFSNCAAGGLLASPFQWETIISIEMTEQGKSIGYSILRKMRQKFPKTEFSIKVGGWRGMFYHLLMDTLIIFS